MVAVKETRLEEKDCLTNADVGELVLEWPSWCGVT